MTVGIVAVTEDDKYIIVAGDRMLSHGDIIQAADDGALKASKIAKKWGITFAGDANRFKPIVRRTIRTLHPQNENCREDQVRDAILLAYRQEFEQLVVSHHLAKLGYQNISQFMTRGRAELGETAFQGILKKIEVADLGISILAYGFDAVDMPSIFEISNPGVYTSHDLLGCAAIGSGVYMATASLRRRPPLGILEEAVYRVLDAKFSSETASGVGRATTLFILNSEGQSLFLDDADIEKIRADWIKISQQPDPKSSITFLKKMDLKKGIESKGVDED